MMPLFCSIVDVPFLLIMTTTLVTVQHVIFHSVYSVSSHIMEYHRAKSDQVGEISIAIEFVSEIHVP